MRNFLAVLGAIVLFLLTAMATNVIREEYRRWARWLGRCTTRLANLIDGARARERWNDLVSIQRHDDETGLYEGVQNLLGALRACAIRVARCTPVAPRPVVQATSSVPEVRMLTASSFLEKLMDLDFEARVRILAWLQDPGSDPFPVPTCRPELFAMQVPGTTVYVGGCRTVGSKVYLVDAATLGDSDELPPTR